MNEIEVFQRLGLALAIGLLLGLERGWHGRSENEGERAAGIRTFALTGLLGGLSGWLSALSAPVVLVAAFLGLAALIAVGYVARLRKDDDVGLTTEVALLLTFALGAASVLGDMAPPAAVAVVATLLLSMKARLHGWVAQMRSLELDALLRLALISVVVLPFLPNEGFGPGGALNPYELWWAVVIVAGLSFLGYLAVRLGGADLGMTLTGLFGGLASSTSTTLALARLVKGRSSLAPLAAAGIVIAGSVSFLRILLLVAIFRPALVPPLAWPMGVMAAVGLAGALSIHLLRGDRKDRPEEIGGISNPLDLKAALSFGLILAIVVLAVHYLDRWLGTGGVYVGAALSGLTDVDALTISVSNLVEGDFTAKNGAVAIFIAASVNTVVKGVISAIAGTPRLGFMVLSVYALVLATGAASLWLF